MKKPPYELESLRAAMFLHDKNIAALQKAIQNEEVIKNNTDDLKIQTNCAQNINIFNTEIKCEKEHKVELNFYIKEHEQYRRHCQNLN